jgi:hypothetical protein
MPVINWKMQNLKVEKSRYIIYGRPQIPRNLDDISENSF